MKLHRLGAGCAERLRILRRMTPLEMAAALNAAADYIDAHGLRRYGWGRPGGAACMSSALAIAIDRHPDGLGRFGLHAPGGGTVERVGRLILESGLLDYLPPVHRGDRDHGLSPVRAVRELARWSDTIGRDAAYTASALRSVAVGLLPAAPARDRAPAPVLVTA